MNTADIAEFIQLTTEKRRLQADLKKVQDALDELEPAILLQFREAGVESVKQNGYLVYQSSRVWAKCEFVDLEQIRDEFPTLLSIQSIRAGSLLSELLAQDDKEALAQLAAAGITPNQVTRLNVRKS